VLLTLNNDIRVNVSQFLIINNALFMLSYKRTTKEFYLIIRRMTVSLLLNIIICFLLPPLGVFIKFGVGKALFLNVLLTIFFFVPGVIHAIWVTVR